MECQFSSHPKLEALGSVFFPLFPVPSKLLSRFSPQETLQWTLNFCYHEPDNPLYQGREFPINIYKHISKASGSAPAACQQAATSSKWKPVHHLSRSSFNPRDCVCSNQQKGPKQEAKSPATASPSPRLTPDIPLSARHSWCAGDYEHKEGKLLTAGAIVRQEDNWKPAKRSTV